MTAAALATFAQVIPVLFIAAFLSNVRIGSDVISRAVALTFVGAGATAEAICLIYIAFDKTPGLTISVTIFVVTLYMLIALVATSHAKLQSDDENRNQHSCECKH